MNGKHPALRNVGANLLNSFVVAQKFVVMPLKVKSRLRVEGSFLLYKRNYLFLTFPHFTVLHAIAEIDDHAYR